MRRVLLPITGERRLSNARTVMPGVFPPAGRGACIEKLGVLRLCGKKWDLFSVLLA